MISQRSYKFFTSTFLCSKKFSPKSSKEIEKVEPSIGRSVAVVIIIVSIFLRMAGNEYKHWALKSPEDCDLPIWRWCPYTRLWEPRECRLLNLRKWDRRVLKTSPYKHTEAVRHSTFKHQRRLDACVREHWVLKSIEQHNPKVLETCAFFGLDL